MKEAAQNASRHLHGVDLHDRAVKRQLLAWSGDLESEWALSELRTRREKALDEIIAAAPLSSFACDSHQNIRLFKYFLASIWSSALRSLNSPSPACLNMPLFFELYNLPRSCGLCTHTLNMCNQAAPSELALAINSFPKTVTWSRP